MAIIYIYSACLILHVLQYLLSFSFELNENETRFDKLFVVMYIEMLITFTVDIIRNIMEKENKYDFSKEFYKFCPSTLLILLQLHLQNDFGTTKTKEMFLYGYPIWYAMMTIFYVYDKTHNRNKEELHSTLDNISILVAFILTVITIFCSETELLWCLIYIMRDFVICFIIFTVIHFITLCFFIFVLCSLCFDCMKFSLELLSKVFDKENQGLDNPNNTKK